jgi:hypothetical protein
MALQGSTRCGKDWQAWNGQVDPEGQARRGRARARHGTAGAARRDRAWNCTAAQARQGPGGPARHGGRGMALPGQELRRRRGSDGWARIGLAGVAWTGMAPRGIAGTVWRGQARSRNGMALQAWPERQRLAARCRRGVDRWAPMGLVTRGRHGSVGRDWLRRTGKARRELVRRGDAGVAWLDGARHRKAQPAWMLLPKCSRMGA